MLTKKLVWDPEHARYGKHLSVEHVNELVKPTTERVRNGP